MLEAPGSFEKILMSWSPPWTDRATVRGGAWTSCIFNVSQLVLVASGLKQVPVKTLQERISLDFGFQQAVCG